jgi:hypothetical protein
MTNVCTGRGRAGLKMGLYSFSLYFLSLWDLSPSVSVQRMVEARFGRGENTFEFLVSVYSFHRDSLVFQSSEAWKNGEEGC